MVKADIAENIQETTGFSKKVSNELLETVFSLLKRTLETGEKIKIAGFGNFEVQQKKERKGRNPQTGETIIIESRRILSFKASSVLKKSLNRCDLDELLCEKL